MQANKALVQLTAAMLTAALPLITRGNTGELTPTEWVNVGVAMTGAGTVYIAANLEGQGWWNYTKAIMSAISAGLMLLVSFLTDGTVSRAEWAQIGMALVGTLAVALISNSDPVVIGRHREVP